MPLGIGQVLENRYRIDALLGRGGMGAVYRAVDLRFNTPVAIKENLVDTSEAQRQFTREAGLLHQLRHPNLPHVTDYFLVPGQGQYLVMDYVEGEDLRQILARQGRLPEAQALAWIGEVLRALDYLHRQGIVHRDVKPANVKITPQGQVILVDFGLAKVYDPGVSTTIGARGVTPGFAPPEQYSAGRTDVRSDLYSAGATLYALLTGQTPPDALQTVTRQVPLIPPRALNAAVSPHVDAAIVRAMQVAPADRFQSAAEFYEALTRQPDVQKAEPARRRRGRATPAWLWAVGAAGVVLVLGIVVALFALGGDGPPVEMTASPEAGQIGGPILTPTVTPEQPIATLPVETPPATAPGMGTVSTPDLPTKTPELPTNTPELPTNTPELPTNTPEPPTGTPEPAILFEAVPLGAAANGSSDFLSPPVGTVTLGGVPFELSNEVFKSQASPSPNDTYPTSARLAMDIAHASRVHLLLNTGNGFTEYGEKTIGRIIATCDGEQFVVADLVLGRNIREWQAAEAKTVSAALEVQEVWQGTRADHPTLTGYIDMLSLDLPDLCRTTRLTALEIVDTSSTTVDSLDPAITLTGVTVEHVP